MYLDNQKKEMIDQIISEGCISFPLLLEKKRMIVEEKYCQGGVPPPQGIIVKPGDSIWTVSDSNRFRVLFKDYLKIVQHLSTEELVERIWESSSFPYEIVFVSNNGVHDYDNQIFNDLKTNWNQKYLQTEALLAYKKRNYKTTGERRLEDEIRDRKFSQALTVVVAITSIVFSTISTIASCTQQNQVQKVEIITGGP